MGALIARFLLMSLTVCIVVVQGTHPVSATELTSEQCEALRSTRDALVSLGVRTDMRQGPQWATDNLAEDRLERVKRYVTSQEDVLFKCRSIPHLAEDGWDHPVSAPYPKPFYKRRTFPLPVRKPAYVGELRSTLQ